MCVLEFSGLHRALSRLPVWMLFLNLSVLVGQYCGVCGWLLVHFFVVHCAIVASVILIFTWLRFVGVLCAGETWTDGKVLFGTLGIG